MIYLCNSSGRLHAQKEHIEVSYRLIIMYYQISNPFEIRDCSKLQIINCVIVRKAQIHFSLILTVEKLFRLLRRRDRKRLEVRLPHLSDQLLDLGLPRRDLVLDLLNLEATIFVVGSTL